MTISEKLYNLRKERKLSQEQLAEVLNISRQAISKWESGASLPEYDNLIVLSEFFGVTLDYLMKDEMTEIEANASSTVTSATRCTLVGRIIAGVYFTIGAIFFIAWSLLTTSRIDSSGGTDGSSTVVIDGNALILILSLISVIVGTVFLIKSIRSNKK